MADNKASYAASAAITISLGGLATSSTLVAGRSSALVDNTSGLYLDRPITAQIKMGTTPTVSTVVEVWCIPQTADGTYFDTFDGTNKNVTVTSRQMLVSYGIPLGLINVDSTTTGNVYGIWSSIAARCGTLPPKKYQIFIVHNTGAALNATDGNHILTEFPIYVTTN